MSKRFLIISASMGAGHNGAAWELQRRLEADGHVVAVEDTLELAPFRLMHLVRWSYESMLRVAPMLYELTYKLWILFPFLYAPMAWFSCFIARRRFKQAIDRVQPDVVISTYCLATLVIGRMRKKHWLRVPAVTFLTDFAVHPLCVHPGIDLTLAVSPQSATDALANRAGAVAAPGPLVPERFIAAKSRRAEIRDRYGIPDDHTVALVVAGSWGVGDVVATVKELAAIADVHPVIVCGKDVALKAELDACGIGTVIGWTDEMAALMGAADVVVENAGGLTCMEAFRVGVPVVTYRPIPGHGLDNARHMDAADVSRFVSTSEDLAAVLAEVASGAAATSDRTARAEALFAGDAARDVLGLALRADRSTVPFRRPRAPRVLRAAALVLLVAYAVMTLGTQAATARGVGVLHAPAAAQSTAFLGVRLTEEQIADPILVAKVAALNASAVVDGRTAKECGDSLATLRAAGITVANGGWGKGDRFRWNRARSDVGRAGALVEQESGTEQSVFVPGRRIDAFDIFISRRAHQKIVRPDHIIRNGSMPEQMRGRSVYLIDGRGLSPAELAATLDVVNAELATGALRSAPLAQLA